MALVYPDKRSASNRSIGTVNLSTNADGITGADVLDMGGLSLAAISLSTLCGSSCFYTFRGGNVVGTSAGSTDGLSDLQYILNSTGSLVSFGTTLTSSQNKLITFDPQQFAGVRFIQIVSNTTSAVNANSPGAVARLILANIGAR